MNHSAKSDFNHIQGKVFFPSVMVFIIVTLLVTYSYSWNIQHIRNEQIQMAVSEAKANWNKDEAFRQWATRHGGVYVTPDGRTPPNPALSHIPDRDVITTDGKKLTLMNPAYMMRQMTKEFESGYGIKGKITGKKQLNPINAPDAWEALMLELFESSDQKEIYQQADINGEPYIRYMKAVHMTEGCVKCHAVLGYKEGDLRGGVSISIPLEPYFALVKESSKGILATHIIVWLIATAVLFIFMRMISSLLVEMSRSALHDALTGLPNISLFRNRIQQSIQRQKRNPDYQFAVCFMDLDHFKDINDSHGHIVGDHLLVQIARMLEKVVRPTDTVARMGGDEFTFLLDDVRNVDEVVEVAQRIIGTLNIPFTVGEHTVYTAGSIGICLSGGHCIQAEDFIRDADIAMYRAKDAGRNRIDVFNPEMHEHAIKTLQIETDLRVAIERKQLEVYYQPVIDLNSNRIKGFEALLRWNHPTMGMVPPDRFIPIAEHSGQINTIGNWVLENACLQVRDWNLIFGKEQNFELAVNLSGLQLANHDIRDEIQGVLSYTRFDPKNLHLEVTETMLVTHKEMAKNSISELRELGISFSIDDFGTGYSSLNYLQQYQFDTLKIDKSFIQDMETTGKGRQLVRTLMLLARDLQMEVVAEGVETEPQFDRLKGMKCPCVQGYYFSKPLPAKQMEQMLELGCHSDAELLRQQTEKHSQQQAQQAQQKSQQQSQEQPKADPIS
ncbi:MAG: EAL domain-containing protein [Motiliproteus sp.]|nr:EAL domain-containing protein [Motiliproteus sp.]MCW9053897.1 EAL domain-containing protein [Motiliproteus sp.]